MRALLVAISLVFLVGCEPITASSVSKDVCIVNADDPHRSSHVIGRINVEGWFKCSVTLQDATLRVELYQSYRGDSAWQIANSASESFNRIKVSRKYKVSASISCTRVRVKARSRIEGHESNGAYFLSPWEQSSTKSNLC